MQSILGHTRKADITFHRNGRIDISAIVTKSLGLNAGDVLDICMSDYGEYYLVIAQKAINTNGNHRAKVFVTKKGRKHNRNMRTYCVKLCKAMLELHQTANEKVSFAVGSPVKDAVYGLVLPIITRLNLSNNDKGNKL